MSELPVLHDTDVDGVRCLWAPSGRPTLRASLAFRHGIADEPATESGWQHLVEHLCLEANPGHGGLDVNGSVSLHETTFDAHGEPEAVIAHLRAITAWLRSPRLDGLAHERQVLRAEAALRGRGPVAEALSWRYGARGPGLAAYDEPGLGRAEEAPLQARIARVFTAGNAVLALDGAPPADLHLDLPSGGLLPLPPAVPYETAPAAFPSGVLTASGVVPRDGSMFVAVPLLERALVERLRLGAGTAYAPWATYERVDARHAVVVAGSDFGPDAVDTVARDVLEILRSLATDGPPPGWLSEEIDRTIRRMRDPYAVGMLAHAGAMRALHGFEPDSLEAMVDRVRAVDIAHVAADAVVLQDSLLLGGPPEVVGDAGLPPLSMPPVDPHPGAVEVRSRNWPADATRLHLHPDRIVVAEGPEARGVELVDLAAYLVYDDGSRHLLRHDGYGLTLDPRVWAGGAESVAFVDRVVPAHLHLPQPARELPPLERIAAPRRWLIGVQHLMGRSALVATLVYALALAPLAFVLQLVLMDRPLAYGIAWSCWMGLVLGGLNAWSDRRASRRAAGG